LSTGIFFRLFVTQAYRAFQDRVGLIADRDRLRREGVAGFEISASAEQCRHQFEFDVVAFLDQIQHLDGFRGDFRADAVAGQYCDFIMLHCLLVDG